MEEKDRISFLEDNLDRQLQWIAAADSRIAFIFTLSTAMLGVLAAISPTTPKDWSLAAGIWASAALAGGLASLLLLSFAAFPRTDGPKGSLVYFGGISQRERDQFVRDVLALDNGVYCEDLAKQCHVNAEIANRKFTWVKRSLISLYLSITPWGLAVYLLYGAR
jgi:hypothetical protein